MELIKKIFKKLFLLLINFYQVCISPLFGSCCRFTPSCSEYTKIAISRFGILKGIKLGFNRIKRCRPGGGYGYDPVPEKI
jgi:uncharacterized protein